VSNELSWNSKVRKLWKLIADIKGTKLIIWNHWKTRKSQKITASGKNRGISHKSQLPWLPIPLTLLVGSSDL